MCLRSIPCCLLIATAAAAGTASASTFSAEARVFSTSASIPTGFDAEASNVPVSALTSTSDPANAVTTGAAGATASQGAVSGLTVTTSGGQRLISYTRATASFNDVLFSWNGSGVAPGTSILVGLRYGLEHEQTASGPLGSSNGRNYRNFTANVGFNGASDAVTVNYDVGGNTVPSDLGERVLFAQVPVGSAVSVSLQIEVASAAFMAARPGPTETSMLASLRIGSVDVQASGARFPSSAWAIDPSLIAFELPEGYTANSVSMGVVDNVWVAGQVPEPATVATMLAGLALLGGLRRTRGRTPRV
jgi:hypothetical protein